MLFEDLDGFEHLLDLTCGVFVSIAVAAPENFVAVDQKTIKFCFFIYTKFFVNN